MNNEVIMNKIKKLQEMINESNEIVFFGGAGVSTDSGIKDFRSKDGLYNQKHKQNLMYMLSVDCFNKEPKNFFDFYRENFNCLMVQPNITHKYLKKLEDVGKLKAIVTQNIDGLHQKAGSTNVYEVHGTLYENYCLECHEFYSAEYIFNSIEIPKCKCGSIIKPKVTLYGEMLPEAYSQAQQIIYEADMLIVAGTSLTVEPASSLVRMFKGKYLVIINNDATFYDSKATLVLNNNLKDVFSNLK